jgi:hypothetical protein
MTTISKSRFSLRHLVVAISMVVGAGVLAVALPAASSFAGTGMFGSMEKVVGSGTIKSETRQLPSFKGLSLGLPAKLELRLGNTESITIEADDNLLPLIEAVVKNGNLEIRPIKKNMHLSSRSFKIVVQAKDIDRISLGGSGSVTADALRAPTLTFDLGGSGQIDIKSIDAKQVSVAVGGSGNFKAGGGAVEALSISIGGSGDVETSKVSSNSANVTVAGSGEATVWAQKQLAVTIAGSGDVAYFGNPTVSKTIVGSGDVTRMHGTPR